MMRGPAHCADAVNDCSSPARRFARHSLIAVTISLPALCIATSWADLDWLTGTVPVQRLAHWAPEHPSHSRARLGSGQATEARTVLQLRDQRSNRAAHGPTHPASVWFPAPHGDIVPKCKYTAPPASTTQIQRVFKVVPPIGCIPSSCYRSTRRPTKQSADCDDRLGEGHFYEGIMDRGGRIRRRPSQHA
jgi:hypothetical protein